MTYCPACGEEVDIDANFCRECGEPVGSTAEATGYNERVNERIKPLLFEKNLFDDVEEWNNIWLVRVSGLAAIGVFYVVISSTPPLSPYVFLPFIVVVLAVSLLVAFWVAATIDIAVYG